MANPYEAKFNVETPAGKTGETAPSAKEPIKGIGNASGASVNPKESTTDEDTGGSNYANVPSDLGGYSGAHMPGADRCATAETVDCIKNWKPPHRR